MGESREGEGVERSETTVSLTRTLIAEYADEGRPVEDIHVQFVTEGLYGVSILVRGEHERESFFISLSDS